MSPRPHGPVRTRERSGRFGLSTTDRHTDGSTGGRGGTGAITGLRRGSDAAPVGYRAGTPLSADRSGISSAAHRNGGLDSSVISTPSAASPAGAPARSAASSEYVAFSDARESR
jgi:hypothetical protein